MYYVLLGTLSHYQNKIQQKLAFIWFLTFPDKAFSKHTLLNHKISLTVIYSKENAKNRKLDNGLN